MTSTLFPSPRLLREFTDLDGHLWSILLDLVERCWPDPHVAARVTCIHRSTDEEVAAGGRSGIHTLPPPYRALDIGGREFTQEQLDQASTALNALWCYDPLRPGKKVCLTIPHGTGPHFHLQVSASTARRNP